jgi:hypothetical protein
MIGQAYENWDAYQLYFLIAILSWLLHVFPPWLNPSGDMFIHLPLVVSAIWGELAFVQEERCSDISSDVL